MTQLKENHIRNKILSSLNEPKGFSELKQELGVSSFGTLTYHLKLLIKSGKVEKLKDDRKQGQPTLYYLSTLKSKEKTPEEMMEKFKKTEKDYMVEALKAVNKKGDISSKEFANLCQGKNMKEWSEGFSAISKLQFMQPKMIESFYRITPAGEKFLKENTK